MSHPDADERRVQRLLRRLLDGPPAALPPLPPGYEPANPPQPRDDWWNRLYAEDDQPDT